VLLPTKNKVVKLSWPPSTVISNETREERGRRENVIWKTSDETFYNALSERNMNMTRIKLPIFGGLRFCHIRSMHIFIKHNVTEDGVFPTRNSETHRRLRVTSLLPAWPLASSHSHVCKRLKPTGTLIMKQNTVHINYLLAVTARCLKTLQQDNHVIFKVLWAQQFQRSFRTHEGYKTKFGGWNVLRGRSR
jgi:hypothetical protein